MTRLGLLGFLRQEFCFLTSFTNLEENIGIKHAILLFELGFLVLTFNNLLQIGFEQL